MSDPIVDSGNWPEAADDERKAEGEVIQAIEEVLIVARHVPPDKRDALWGGVQHLEARHIAWLEAKQRTSEAFEPMTSDRAETEEEWRRYEAAVKVEWEAKDEVIAALHEADRLAQYVPGVRRDALWNAVRTAHTRLVDWQRLDRRTNEAMDIWGGWTRRP